MNSVIEAEELLGALKKLGISAVTLEEAGRVLSQADADGNGLLNKRQLLSMMDLMGEDPARMNQRDDLARKAGQLLQHFNGMREYAP
jgi:Ca2+-binding EF-hand superfamily protein